MAILSGPGGLAVSAAEAYGKAGLKLAELEAETRSDLERLIPPTGTSTKNPIDVGLAASLDIDIYIQAARITAQDPNVDTVAIIGAGLTVETNEQYTQGLIKACKDFQKPFLIIKIPGFDEDLAQRFCVAGIPFFDSAERTMQTYSRIQKYYLWCRKQNQPR